VSELTTVYSAKLRSKVIEPPELADTKRGQLGKRCQLDDSAISAEGQDVTDLAEKFCQ
jgi:hypothetical protein